MNSASPSGTDVFQWTANWATDLAIPLWSAQETGSTNTIAKEAPVGSTTQLYLARNQTQGRGRNTNQWITPSGSSLLSSWSFLLQQVPQPIFSPLAGLALYDACLATWPDVAFNMKAPNDLYISDKKVAGLLIETIDQGHEIRTVIGLGFNITAKPESVPTATYLWPHLIGALTEDRWRFFLNAWYKGVQEAIVGGQSGQLEAHERERLKTALNRHPLLKEPILDVDERGQLRSASRVIHWHEL